VGAAGTPPPTVPVQGSTGGTGGGRNALIIGAVIVAAAIVVGALVIGQNLGSASPSAAPSAAPTEAATATPEPTPTPAPTPTPNACAPENLATLAAGVLTLGADNPAYPPYFEISDPVTPPWELGDPTNGKGFEGAVAYAVADKLGFSKEKVTWTVVPFNNSFAPGAKPFDFYITQVSWTPERAEAVDLSDGYYFVNQSIVAMNGSPLIGVTSTAALAPYKFGAQVGTTSYDTIVEVIKPTQDPAVFDTNDAAIQALQNGQIDGLVVDLPTAFYVTAAQIVDADFNPLAAIVGQFPAPAEGEFFSLVLAKDSPLTACVNQAIAALKADGTLESITQEWLADKANAPVFGP
jgi:polar amino acid transport system substrate-binding protein